MNYVFNMEWYFLARALWCMFHPVNSQALFILFGGLMSKVYVEETSEMGWIFL